MNRITAFILVVCLSPLLVFLLLIVVFDLKTNPIYSQIRVGKYGKPFSIYKIRTMRDVLNSSGSLLTVGNDPRISKSGYHLRKYKLDELLQLFNVLKGDMNFIGHRPEVPKYASLNIYKPLLQHKPGIIDLVSFRYRNESFILSQQANPEEFYTSHILPDKISGSLEEYRKRRIVVFFLIVKAYVSKLLSVFFKHSN